MYISLYNQTLHVIVQGECVSHFFAGFESQLTPKYILLFNQSFYVKVRIYHRASNIMHLHPNCCSDRFKTGVFLCMFERGSIMSYAINIIMQFEFHSVVCFDLAFWYLLHFVAI